eukprot:1162131-Pelagomonas_calceolata.AAC.19
MALLASVWFVCGCVGNMCCVSVLPHWLACLLACLLACWERFLYALSALHVVSKCQVRVNVMAVSWAQVVCLLQGLGCIGQLAS